MSLKINRSLAALRSLYCHWPCKIQVLLFLGLVAIVIVLYCSLVQCVRLLTRAATNWPNIKTLKGTFTILRFADTAAILILPPGHPIMIVEINIFLCEKLISMFIMGCPGGKIHMAAVSAKRSIEYENRIDRVRVRISSKLRL